MAFNEVLITNVNALTRHHQSDHPSYESYRYDVLKMDMQNRCCIAVYEIPPGKAGFPYHYHTKFEENFYIVSGCGTLETPDGEKTVSAGDFICCPTGEKGAHKLSNASNTEMLVYIDFDTIAFPEAVFYPHSKKIGVQINSEVKKFYKEGSDVSVYEGE